MRRRVSHGSSLKSSGAQAAGGMLLGLVDHHVLSGQTFGNMFQGSPYMKPLALGVLGHFVKRKAPNIGAGALGAAGYMLYQAWTMQQPAPLQPGTQGLVEAGYYGGGAPMNAFGPGQAVPAYAYYQNAGSVVDAPQG
jgi:hypothetical protein